MTKHQKTQEIRTAVRTQIKRINLWRKLNVPWKAILKELGLSCSPDALERYYHTRWLY